MSGKNLSYYLMKTARISGWLLFFLVIFVVEVATIPLVFMRPALGRICALAAAALNILQVVADQAHLMQPEVASIGYSVLEGAVAIVSLLWPSYTTSLGIGRMLKICWYASPPVPSAFPSRALPNASVTPGNTRKR